MRAWNRSHTPHMKPTHIPLLGLCLLSTFLSKAQAFFPDGEDNFANAPFITTQNDVSSQTSLLSATKESGEPGHHPGEYDGAGKSVWWKWTAPESGFCSLETITPSYFNSAVENTVICVYTGSAFPLTRVADNDNHSTDHFAVNAFQSKVSFYATAGTTYSIAVDGAYEGTVVNNSDRTQLRLRHIPARPVTRRAVWLMRSELNGAGSLSMTTTASGSYTAVFQRGAAKYPFTGVFDRDGTTTRSVLPVVAKGSPPAAPITLRIDGAGAGQFALETADFTVGGEFPRQMVYSKTVLNPMVGIYNLGGLHATQYYHERGWMQATVSATGAVNFAGTGPDGFKFTVGTFMHEVSTSSTDFSIPGFSPLHGNKGFIHFPGTATLNTNISNDPQITANCWYQLPSATTKSFYRFGYLNTFELKGKRYVKPALNARVQGFLDTSGSGQLRMRESPGEMADPLDELVTLSTANKFTFATPLPRKVSMSVNTTNGLVTGSITTTDTIEGVTKARVRKLQGLIFREGPNVWLRGHATGVTKNLFMEVVYNY
jgi:hypothetical protein